ncbi:MAG: hypothetical protein Hals2KO_28740 [Halioglobus sp.]
MVICARTLFSQPVAEMIALTARTKRMFEKWGRIYFSKNPLAQSQFKINASPVSHGLEFVLVKE